MQRHCLGQKETKKREVRKGKRRDYREALSQYMLPSGKA
jgi:hypothetical protein